MNRTATRALFVLAPLAFAALLLLHPMGEDSFSALAFGSTDRWLAVHVGSAALFPLMAFLVWTLLKGVESRAATVARVALPVFAVFYGVWEALTGIATGLVAQDGAAATGPARQALADTIDRLGTHPISGEFGLFNSVGSAAWIVAVAAAVVALRGIGVRRSALALLALATLMVMHVPPIGPVALVCLSAAALLVEHDRRSWASGRAPAMAPPAVPA
jgi:hypothetical protein